jgi:hypothetical protein
MVVEERHERRIVSEASAVPNNNGNGNDSFFNLDLFGSIWQFKKDLLVGDGWIFLAYFDVSNYTICVYTVELYI